MTEFLAIATAALSLALVCVTIWYAWQTQQMVREMASSRAAAIRPALRLDFGVIDGSHAFLVLENVGVGPAMQVSVTLEIKGFAGTPTSDPLSLPLIRPGDRRDLFYPAWGGKDLMTLETLASVPARITLAGECCDLDGRVHTVSDVLDFSTALDRIEPLPLCDASVGQLRALDRIDHNFSQLNQALGRLRGEG